MTFLHLYKEKVLKSSLISAILYGCEAWFSGNLRNGIFATGRGMTDNTLMFALTLAEAGNTMAWLNIKSAMAESDYLRKDRVKLCD